MTGQFMSTNTEVRETNRKLEKLKWTAVFSIIAVAIIGNYMYRYVSLPIRTLAVLGLILIAGAIAFKTTSKGKAAVVFAQEARIEMRKVIWPTRQEAIQTTIMVAVITAIISLLLAGFDAVLLRLISIIIK